MADGATAAATAAVSPMSGIRSPAALCLEANIAENWRLFKHKWRNYAIITNLERQATNYQVALLLHVMGDQALKVYIGFQFDTDEEARRVDQIILKFDEFAVGELNETYMFNKRNQNEGETFENVLTNLRTMIKTCQFCNKCVSLMLRDRIVLGIRDNTTQQLLLREKDLTLEKTINICKATENATLHGKAYRTEPETVHKVSSQPVTIKESSILPHKNSVKSLKRMATNEPNSLHVL